MTKMQNDRAGPSRALEVTASGHESTLLEAVQDTLIHAVADVLRIDCHGVSLDMGLNDLGFDSLSLGELSNFLNGKYALELIPPVFFEYPTLRSFAGYLVREYREAIASAVGLSGTGEYVPAAAIEFSAAAQQPAESAAAVADTPRHDVMSEPVAIVGMSGAFPQAENVDVLWKNLVEGRTCVREVPADRWDWLAMYGDPRTQDNKTRVKWGGFIDGVREFDASFFGISTAEAVVMEPQQRLLVTHVWKVIEDAGYSAQSLAGSRTGIFIGLALSGYGALVHEAGVPVSVYSSTGVSLSSGPNRMSHLLDLHGPSEPIETACSSSLVAVHRAVQAIRSGQCDAAIVGGVNTLLTPDGYISLDKLGVLSPDGRCKTFSAHANGYVRGEGVGMLMLKRLSDAERDRDHIYGIIRGTAENHGGRASSIGAPNPVAQAELVRSAYREAGVDPRTVTYIETHGTGTSLGDPIEINGLKSAFAQLYAERGLATGEPAPAHCGLGSVKTGIGHLETAAGIVGMIKVLMQLRHRTLAPSLHCDPINPFIELEGSPFYIVTERQPWHALCGPDGRELPRRAGVSSFGFGGVNAHVLIEEYVARDRIQPRATVASSRKPVIIVLSARTDERLVERTRQLLEHIREQAYTDADLPDIAYTLQVGREAMEHRLAFVAGSIADLATKLVSYVDGSWKNGEIAGLHVGQVKKSRDPLAALSLDEEFADTVRRWMLAGKVAKVMDLWTKGLTVDWGVLYGQAGEAGRRRLRLPTYPFARETYWVKSLAPARHSGATAATVLHPLAQRNTSTLKEQRFSSTFTGDEWFLRDHRIQGEKILPAAAMLEMARAAVYRSEAEDAGHGNVVLRDVVFLRPLRVTGPKDVHVRVSMSNDERILFEIFTSSEEGERAGEVVYAQGRVELSRAESAGTSQGLPRDGRGADAQSIDVASCYEAFRSGGVEYGPAHRALSALWVTTDETGRRRVLAKVVLPECVADGHLDFELHPSVLDGALQATLGFAQSAQTKAVQLPFALERLDISARTPSVAWVQVQAGEPAGGVDRLNIDICDESGRVCARLTGLVSRALSRDAQLMLLARSWQKQPVLELQSRPPASWFILVDPAFGERLPQFRDRLPTAVIERLSGAGEADGDSIEGAANQVLSRVQEILRRTPQAPVLLQVVMDTSGLRGALAAAVAGLLRSARTESSALCGQVIAFQHGASVEEIARAVTENAQHGGREDSEVRYRGGIREVNSFRELNDVAALEVDGPMPWRNGGIYLVTGGLGGLGALFVSEIAARTRGAKIILVGRSTLGTEARLRFDSLQRQCDGALLEYRMLDVSDTDAVATCVADVVHRHGALNGILHSAGVTRDGLIVNKTPAELAQVLAPKVRGLLSLQRATESIDLDWMILFSSAASVLGSVGQADYAFANAFMDGYAAACRGEQHSNAGRCGRTLSINWQLWAEGGMRLAEAGLEQLHRDGVEPLTTAAGLAAFYACWRSRESQVLVLYGSPARIQRNVLRPRTPSGTGEKPVESFDDASVAALTVTVRQALIRTTAQQLRVSEADIDPDTEVGEFGFDSIAMTVLSNDLNRSYELDLSPTVFFEHPTINRLASHLVDRYGTSMRKAFAAQLEADTTSPSPTAVAEPAAGRARDTQQDSPGYARSVGHRFATLQANTDSPRFATARAGADSEPLPAVEPVAIIGVSGCFPEATDVEAFWDNLSAGKDSISEIPLSRWDWRAIHGDPLKDANTTNIHWGGFIQGVEEFDSLFFGISPREARAMDPHQRLLLTYSWKAIEDAGYSPRTLSGSRTGVFVGTTGSGYAELIARAGAAVEAHSATGTSGSIGPNRVSFFLDLHGPSEPIETACSSSLVALHRAVRSMRSGECDLALAGGVNTLLTPSGYISFGKAGMLSEDGRCRTFSKHANGYVRGEGIGMLFLKKFRDAERDGDHIYAVVRGSAVNHGGRANSLTAPNPNAQAELIEAAWQDANVDPRTVTYIEAHGTGTPLGDPIEIDGLKSAFEQWQRSHGVRDGQSMKCGIGSVKTNIGHLELAAGIAGVIKVLLQMKHRTLVKSLHAEEINPYIQLEGSPFYIVRENQPWPVARDEQGGVVPRRAGVSSFGFGGVNAHLILEEYFERARPTAFNADREALIVLSAKSEERVRECVALFLGYLKRQSHEHATLADIAYTLQVGREPMECRLGFTARSIAELEDRLEAFLRGSIEGFYRGEVRKRREVAFCSEEAAREAVATAIERGELTKLLELWTQGLPVDWAELYRGLSNKERPRRVSLPTYPFQKQRCWIDATAVEPPHDPVANAQPPRAEPALVEDISEKPAGLQLPPLGTYLPAPFAAIDTGRERAPDSPAQPAVIQLPARDIEGASMDSVHRILRETLARLLGVELHRIADDEAFLDLGVDSVTGVEWTHALSERFGTAIKPARIYDYPTIERFARYLVAEIGKSAAAPKRGPPTLGPRVVPETVAGAALESPRPARPTSTQPRRTFHSVVHLEELESGIALVTMEDRESKNTFSRRLGAGLLEVFEQIRASESTKAVVLTGYDTFFCCGGTKEDLLAIEAGSFEFSETALSSLNLYCPVPVIAAMQGHAIGAGWAFGMFCDFLVLSLQGIYEASFMRYGFTPGAGATLIFPQRFPPGLAQEILFTARRFTGEELQRRGFSYPVVHRDAVLPHALELARALCQSPRESLIELKRHLTASLRDSLERTGAREVAMHERTFVHRPEVRSRIEATYGDRDAPVPATEAAVAAPMPSGARHPARSPTGIAIIGMSGAFPQATSLEQFWNNLAAGADSIAEIPPQRWSLERFFDANPRASGKTYSKWMGVLEEVDCFDPLFFNISPAEAEAMDPQHRLFLEHCWSSIESAGINPRTLSESRCGVYVGCAPGDYGHGLTSEDLSAEVLTGNASSILSARISYFLNLKGPCLAIDTACSSSLVAICEACDSLLLGRCELALAGGVCVLSGPGMHIMTSRAGMLSPGGRCFTFDDRADGFVPGEGVGVVLLKRLDDAIRDEDLIHGVIRGWGVGQDGKTNGIMAPSVNSQIELQKRVYQEFGIDPQSITLVEAHGTGTRLGDPIEVEALVESFRSFTARQQFCALGSVKSNIGHLLQAAGVAGLIKLLLAIRNEQLPPTIHFRSLNPHIELKGGPFYINTELKPWLTTDEQPRRAAVSSFGISGTNSHVVVEEFRPTGVDAIARDTGLDLIFVISAKTDEQLRTAALRLLYRLEQDASLSLQSIAYTLQVGREPMEHRCAFVAGTREEVIEALRGYLANAPSGRVFNGRASAQQPNPAPLGDVLELAQEWVKGARVDWSQLYTGRKPPRVSLPTYPFARERYWKSQSSHEARSAAAAPEPGPVRVHPLLQENTSTFSGHRFSSHLRGDEFFLREHVVQGRRVLPGVCYLEMAHQAVARCSGVDSREHARVQLEDIVWTRPLEFGKGPMLVHIDLKSAPDGRVEYAIHSDDSIRCRGRASVLETPARAEYADLPAIRARCREEVPPARCYEAMRAAGLELGPAFLGLQSVFAGSGEVLAKLRATDETGPFTLPPTLMDSALQASVCLALAQNEPRGAVAARAALLFSIQVVQILRPCGGEMWSWVRQGETRNSNLLTFDVDVTNEQGEICVRFRGIGARTTSADGELISLVPVWDAVIPTQQAFDSQGVIVLVGGTSAQAEALARVHPALQQLNITAEEALESISDRLSAIGKVDHIVWCAPIEATRQLDTDELIGAQKRGVLAAFRLVKALLRLGYGSERLALTAITVQAQGICKAEPIDPAHASVHGFVGSLAKEYPKWRVRLVDLGREDLCPWTMILQLPPDESGDGWAYREGQWYRPSLLACAPAEVGVPAAFRTEGVYVVIGGAGGIGEVFSEHVISRCRARVIWIGRRAADEEIVRKQARLAAAYGVKPDYIAADATDRLALDRALLLIKQRYGRVNAVVHSAVGIFDESIMRMSEERFAAILAVKVDVCVRLAQLFASEPLDFVLFFSSINSFGRDSGKSGYSAGCTFKDAFAHQMALQWPGAVKVMNWGYWAGVGTGKTVPQVFKNRLAQMGIGSITAEEGMAALEALLAGPFQRIAVVKTTAAATSKPTTSADEWVTTVRQRAPRLNGFSGRLMQGVSAEATRSSAPDPTMGLTEDPMVKVLWQQLSALGLGSTSGQTLDEWLTQAGIRPGYRRWAQESVRILVDRGLLTTRAGALEKTHVDLTRAWADWDAGKSQWLKDRNLRAQVQLVDTALRALPDILSGRRSATEILFEGSSVGHVEGVYTGNAAADYLNEVLSGAVSRYVGERLRLEPQAKIRILEIGAGTGATSAFVFEKLRAVEEHIEEYCYSDVSNVFLQHAQQRFAAQFRYVRLALFDVERAPRDQALDQGGYDIVIAANVLHATRDVRRALRNAKAAMKGNGLLVLNEFTQKSLWAHLTFGLLDGWWRYEDESVRIPGCPGLSEQRWRQVLAEEGFEDICLPLALCGTARQHIIVARSDGIVRQKRAAEYPSQHIPVANEMKSAGPAAELERAAETGADEVLRERSERALRRLVGERLKIPLGRIEPGTPLEQYGIDSILTVQLTESLREWIPNVTSTLFFECQSIAELVKSLMRTERQALRRWVGLDQDMPAAAGEPLKQPEALLTPPISRTLSVLDTRPARPETPFDPTNQGKQQDGRNETDRGVAIIGLSGRYPHAATLQQYWENLKAGRECIQTIPPERWSLEGFYCPDMDEALTQGKSYCKWGGFIDGFAEFDASFFNISPREAACVDPQERLFLQASWEVLEDAGYSSQTLARRYQGRVGVFAGITKTGFELHGPTLTERKQKVSPYTSFSSVANRVSFVLDLHGPSMPIDTMCSSSLTAIHEACEHLLREECELAIAGGVNLYLHSSNYIRLCGQRMLSLDGKCRTFGAGASGIVPGEGVGAVLLKPLRRAMEDGDHIYAVIRGTSVNHGGRTNGYTVPNPNAQRDLVEAALRRAAVNPRAISYIEAHGTGTELGDPIEISALTQALGRFTPDVQFCAIGSVKPNIGHLESAAGMAGLTKVLLQMKHGELVPSLHSRVLNPHVDFARTPFVVQQETAPWQRPVLVVDGQRREFPRIAGVSSFGAGGANAHVIVEEFIDTSPREQQPPAVTPERPALIVLSARTAERLPEQAKRLLEYLRTNYNTSLIDIAYTLQVGRDAMEYRLAFAADSVSVLDEKLAAYIAGAADRDGIEEFYRGDVRSGGKILALLTSDEELLRVLSKWPQQGKYGRLLELWVSGLAIDWETLYQSDRAYGACRPQRVSLPTYPFARQRFWLDVLEPSRAVTEPAPLVGAAGVQLAPLRPMPVDDTAAVVPAADGRPNVVLCTLDEAAAPPPQIQAVAISRLQRSARVLIEPQTTQVVVATVPTGSLEQELAESLAAALYMDREAIDLDRPFLELGLDSILGVEWIRIVNRDLGLRVTATRLYEYPTVRQLAAWLSTQVNEPRAGGPDVSDQHVVSGAPIPSSAPAVQAAPVDPQLVLAASVPLEALEGELASSLAAALYMDCAAVDPDRPFLELGLDSILGVEWIRAINKRYGLAVTATRIYEYPTLRQFAEWLRPQVSRSPAQVSARSPALAPVPLPTPVAVAQLTPELATLPTRERTSLPTPESAPLPPAARSAAAQGVNEAIAIVGMSGRYPGAPDLSCYWNNLVAGRLCVEEIPKSRWDVSKWYDPQPGLPGKTYCKWLGRLDDIEYFDPLFFNISPAEAEAMDPQQRLFLEESYKAFEDAGYGAQQLNNRNCGVYLGIMSNEYSLLLRGNGKPDLTGNSAAIAAARIAYILNLKGPALAVDTACSSSLVCTHLACQALRTGEVDMALAGGVTLWLSPEAYVGMCAAGLLSPEGRCKTFDDSANGFVPGEGVGALVLKRLRDAEADGDHIYGVIIGSGINQDGRTNGITAPSLASQVELARTIYTRFDIHPESISYVEMHGTGTKLGDPIELEALATAFREKTQRQGFCAIGAVKSNLGHTSAAAGAASVHKVLLALQHGELPPTLHFNAPNRHFDFAASPFFVNTERRAWAAGGVQPRRAAVSSFGFSGTNAHVVIEDYRPASSRKPARGTEVEPLVFVLSARNQDRLRDQATRLAAHIEARNPDSDELSDIAYTLQVGREAMEHRLAFVAINTAQTLNALSSFMEGKTSPELYVGRVRRNVAGSGTQGAEGEWKQESSAVADAWTRGVAVDWPALYAGREPTRVSLPTYPFARERYWIQATEEVAKSATVPSSGSVNRAGRLLTKGWLAEPLSAAAQSPQRVAVVCVRETQSFAGRLAARFADGRILVLDDDVRSALDEEAWRDCEVWIDVVGCGLSRSHEISWVALLQSWMDAMRDHDPLALCITRGLESHDSTTVNLSGATRAGLYRMLSSEYTRIRSRHVDVDPRSDEADIVQQVVGECADRNGAVEVCYRRAMRYRAVLQQKELSIGSVDTGRLRFSPDRVLWITGGTRGIGYACAQHFVREHGAKRLLLTGREPFPPREMWEQVRREETSVGRKIRAVLALEAQGAEVEVLSLPLSDAKALLRGIRAVKERWGAIGGVIHCAGVVADDNPAFIRKTTEGIREVLAPKVSGLDHLLECVAAEPLQFILLFSSVSAAVPRLAVGLSDYAMANAYMDYVASAWASRLPVMSIQWPRWHETGMGEGQRAHNSVYDDLGFLDHSNAEGLRLMDLLLTRKEAPVVLPTLVDVTRWRPEDLMQPEPGATGDVPSLRIVANEAVVRTASLGQIRAWLKDSVSRELKIDSSRIETDVPLSEYGADSIMLVQWLRPIGERIGATLDPSILFEYPTIDLFSEWLARSYGDALAARSSAPEAAGRIREPSISSAPAVPSPSAGVLSSAGARTSSGLDIAVVGISCRFPGGRNAAEYWSMLEEGRSAIRQVPLQRWGRPSPYFAAVLDDADQFDPAFFLMTPQDARAMDPQARVALEVTLDLCAHAGYSLQELKGRSIGVYLGARSQHVPDAQALAAAQNPMLAVGPNYLAANISRFFDLRGPSLVVDTACSSALVAMSMAIQSLRGGEIESALVGGVSLMNDDAALRMFERRGILNREPVFHLFDRRARGAILGEGAGMVWLKTVDQALQDGDTIYAVVRSVAINNDGRTAGPTAPNLQAQKDVMRLALERSGITPDQVSYIEVNGSGSEVTDLLELKAIEAVYRPGAGQPCELGSTKPNIGHPLCAEGIAGFIKCVLMLHHRRRVPFLSAEQPMQHYDLAASPFRFSRLPVRSAEAPDRVALNCFADGGTNAHAILERWQRPNERAVRRHPTAPPLLQRIDCRPTPIEASEPSVSNTTAVPDVAGLWGRLESLNGTESLLPERREIGVQP